MRGKTVLSRTVNNNGGAFSLGKVSAGRYLMEEKNAGKRVDMSSLVVR